MAEQKKREQFRAPRGVFVYPRLNEPDTKFKVEGEYSVKLALEPDANEDHKKFLDKLEAFYEQSKKEATEELVEKGKGKKTALKIATDGKPWKPEVDDEGEETGRVLVKFAAKATGVNKKTGKPWTFKLPLVDAKKHPVSKSVWGGSEGNILFEPYGWYTALGFGVSLKLKAVQVVKLVSGSGVDVDAAFDDEDGYTEEPEENAAENNTDENNEGSPAAF